MSLKINYLDNKKGSIKNKAIFVQLNTKISAFKGNFDHSISQKSINFLKKNKDTKENKIISLNQDFDQKLIIILLVKNNNELESEKLGAKFFDFVKNNEIYEIYIEVPATDFSPRPRFARRGQESRNYLNQLRTAGRASTS